MTTILLILEPEGAEAIPLASAISSSLGRPLAVVCLEKADDPRLNEITPETDAESEVVAAAQAKIRADELLAPGLYRCTGPRPEHAALTAINDLDARLLIIAAPPLDQEKLRSTAQKLLQGAPLDTLALAPRAIQGPPSRVLVAQIGGAGAFVMRAAARWSGGSNSPFVAVPDPAASARSKRQYEAAFERMTPDQKRRCSRHEGQAEDLAAALAGLVQAGDLVVFQAEDPRHINAIRSVIAGVREQQPDVPFASGVLRAQDDAGAGIFERIKAKVRRHAPHLTREQRRDVFEMLESGGRLSTDFAVMLMLSATIAAFGLIQSSTATVIGAMLVAPLMTPLLAIGAALVQGNGMLFRKAAWAASLGVFGAVLASMCVGLLSPWSDLSAEVVARGAPNPFDLIIALLSGIAAAFAVSRPGLAGTLVGVAIAVALVPPLSATGIAIVKSEMGIAFGAATLFMTNLLAIIVGAALVFRFFGMHAALAGRRAPRWVNLTAIGIFAATLATAGVLSNNLITQINQGTQRPYARPLPANVRAEIVERVAGIDGATIVLMAESNIEHGFGRELILMCTQPIDEPTVDSLEEVLRRGISGDTPVRVLTLSAMQPVPATGDR